MNNQQGMMGSNRYQNQQLYMNQQQQQRLMQQRPMQGNQEGMPRYTQFNSSSNNNSNQQMLMTQKMQMMMQSNNNVGIGIGGNVNSNSNNYGNANNIILQNQAMMNQQQQQQPSMQQFNTTKPQQRQTFISQSQPQLNEPNRLILKMTNEEHTLFSKLFQFVDRENKGRLSAQEAANFLKKSGLPKEPLKQIYVIAAQTSTQFLDRDDFYIALRLVALAQNNLPFTKNSIIINNPIPPLPVFNLQQNENDADVEQVFKMEEIDKEKYKMLFDKNKELQDKITISKSYQMWKSLGVHDTVIQKILAIVQPLQDKNFLNVKEFQVILHLIIKGANYEIPKVLPQCIAIYLRGGFNQQYNNMNTQMQMPQQQPQINPQIQLQQQQQQIQMNQQQPQLQPPTQIHMQQPQMNLHMQQQPQINPQAQIQQQQQQPQIQMYQQQPKQQPVKKDIDILLMNMDCGLPQQQPQQPTTSIGPYLPQQQQPDTIQNILPNQGNQYQPQNFQQFHQQQMPQQYQPSPNKPEDDKAQASSILLEQIEKEFRNYNDLTYQNDCLQTQLHNIKEKIKLCKEQLVKAALAIANQNDEIKKANNELSEVKNQLQITIIERERYEETYHREKAYINQQLQEKQELLRKNQEELQFNQLEHEQIQQKKLLEEEEIARLRNMDKNNTQQNQNKQQVDFEQMNYEDFLNFPSTNDLPVAKDTDFPSTNDNNNNYQMNNDNNNNNNDIHNDIQQQHHPRSSQNMQFNFENVDNDFQIETDQQHQDQTEEPDFGFQIDIPQSNEKVINPYEDDDDTHFDNDDKKQTIPNQFNANISPITSTNFNPSEMNFNQIEHEQNPGQYTIFPSFGSVMKDSKEINPMPGSNPPNFQFEYFNAGNTAFQDFQQKKSNDNFQLNINNNNNNNNFDDFDF